MKQFKRLGVYLDEWPDDVDVLAFTGRIATLAEAESIHCVFWARHEDVEAGGRGDHAAFVRQHLPAELHDRVTVQVERAHAVEALLKVAKDKALDLVLVGRSLPSAQIAVGNAFNRIARKAPCSVLLVPAESQVHLSRILVPVDFSAHAKLAVEAAVQFARASEEAHPQVVAQTVYGVGYGHTKTGMTLEQACEKLGEVNRQQLEEFVKGVDTQGVAFELECTCSEDPAAAVHELAKVKKMDMICVGSRGVTSTAVALLGGTAEQIVAGASAPVLVVKRKGETAHFLEALFGG
jgi:nucleotide-binding universal stress UspA family protein